MKMIMTVIKPFKLDDVRDALNTLGIEGMTVSEVKGYGRQKGQAEGFNDSDYNVSFLPKLRLEIAVSDNLAEKVITAIQDSAHTGRIGDGKIFCYELTHAIRIRTGENGEDAL